MEQYFDAFLYFANWGSRRFTPRLPKKLLDPKMAASYCADQRFSCRQKDDHIVPSFESEVEDYEWDEGESRLASLVPLTLRSDARRPSGAVPWLVAGWAIEEISDDGSEPPVPPGLGQLTTALDCLADFLGIDVDLIAAAAERSAEEQVAIPSRKEIDEWVRTLPGAEKDAIVVRLIGGDDPHLSAEVRQRAIFEIGGGGRTRGWGGRPVRSLLVPRS